MIQVFSLHTMSDFLILQFCYLTFDVSLSIMLIIYHFIRSLLFNFEHQTNK